MQKIFLIVTAMIFTSGLLLAGPARGGVLIFTQADGSTFEGTLKGTSAFHWIESNGAIVKYNSDDKYYHIAKFDANSSLILTDALPLSSEQNAPSRSGVKKQHSVDKTQRMLLQKMQKQKMDASRIE